jgi:cellulose synthase/poly-beta-1,6-N-acetylglucosamine synthase-like glycosyltransferase
VYADSNSSDGSPEVAAQLGATVIRLDPVRPMNAARGRREGTEALVARYPSLSYVFYIDGDCILQPDFLRTAVSFLDEHPRIAAVCGQRSEIHPDASFYNRLCDEEWNTPVGQADACGGDSVMRLAAVLEVGGFDEQLMASEEPELSARLRAAGWEIWRIDAPMTRHDAAIHSFSAYWRRHLRGGVGYFQAWRKTAALPERINGRTLRSSTFWAALLPLGVAILTLAVGNPLVLLLLPAAYLLQIARIASRRGPSNLHEWKAAAVLMLIKPAEFIGAVSAWLRLGRRDAIQYKSVR